MHSILTFEVFFVLFGIFNVKSTGKREIYLKTMIFLSNTAILRQQASYYAAYRYCSFIVKKHLYYHIERLNLWGNITISTAGL